MATLAISSLWQPPVLGFGVLCTKEKMEIEERTGLKSSRGRAPVTLAPKNELKKAPSLESEKKIQKSLIGVKLISHAQDKQPTYCSFNYEPAMTLNQLMVELILLLTY